MSLTPGPGQRLEPIIYYCNIRKQRFKRHILIDDELEIRRALCGVEFILKALGGNEVKVLEWDKMYLLVKSINGKAVRSEGVSSSVAALLFGAEHARAKRVDTAKLWDFTRAAYGIEKAEAKPEEVTA